MNNDIGSRARGRGWPLGVATLIVMASIALLASGCGGGTPSGSDASPSAAAGQSKALAYSECMRSHGVPNFPDPGPNGNLQIPGNLGVSHSVMQAAQQACASLQPGGESGGVSSAQNIAQGLKYAQCIREHGEPNWPDPSSNGAFILPAGISPQSSAVQAAQQACQSVQPHGLNIGQKSS
jgi:hypothetical protein